MTSLMPQRLLKGVHHQAAVGIALGALWAFHASAFGLLGRAYFHVVHLSAQFGGITQAVGPQVLLHPAFLCAAALVFIRHSSQGAASSALSSGSKCGIAIALGCWLLAATLSTMFNFEFDQVFLTYCSVFLAGAAVYVALSRVEVTSRAFELAIVGLALGSLLPLVGGIQAFLQEWGTADVRTTLSAYQDVLRMELYEAATFGSRGNTATFIILIAPLFLWTALDRSRRWMTRTICGVLLVPIAVNVLILEIRAAFLALLFAVAVVFGFRLGLRRYPMFALGLGLAVLLMVRYSPDISDTMSDRLRPVVTLDTVEDASVSERVASIDEGLALAGRHWLLGIGPGASMKRHTQTAAHQFQVQEFMELGVLGLLASVLFAAGVLVMLFRTLVLGQDGGVNNTRFALLIGPATFVVYGTFSNPTLSVGYINTWVVLMASMLAMAPRFEAAASRRRLALI